MDMKDIIRRLQQNFNNPSFVEELMVMSLKKYLERKNKRCFENIPANHHIYDLAYDAILPDGIDSIDGLTAVEFLIGQDGIQPPILKVISNKINYLCSQEQDIKNLLFVASFEIPQSKNIEKQFASNSVRIIIWDINEFSHILEDNNSLQSCDLSNIYSLIFQRIVQESLRREVQEYQKKQAIFLKDLRREYKKDNIVLFLGAGASKEAKIAEWDELISELFVSFINKKLEENSIVFTDNIRNKVNEKVLEQFKGSPLIQTRLLRNGFGKDFNEAVREILYRKCTWQSKLLDEIGQLCIPERGKLGIRAIVNYNFDNLVEKKLEQLRVKCRPVYTAGVNVEKEELGIYHVHGFLPDDPERYDHLSDSLLVFSEEGYHELILDPYHWANMCQLNYMTNHTCVFIGLSMTDPNLRRLLEVSMKHNSPIDNHTRHYAFMRRLNLKKISHEGAIHKFEAVNESIQELFFKELGINVIWIDDFKEIPELLKDIKKD